MLEEEGLAAVWQRHRVFGEAVRAAVQGWGLELNVTDPGARSDSVTTIRTAPGDAARLRAWAEAQGLTLGIGLPLDSLGGPSDALFRIGHMGHLSPPMILGTLATVETGLGALGIPHGPGLPAAGAVVAAAAPAAARAAE